MHKPTLCVLGVFAAGLFVGCTTPPTLANRPTLAPKGTVLMIGAAPAGGAQAFAVVPPSYPDALAKQLIAEEEYILKEVDSVYMRYNGRHRELAAGAKAQSNSRLTLLGLGGGIAIASTVLTSVNAASHVAWIAGLGTAAGGLNTFQAARASEGFTPEAYKRRLALIEAAWANAEAEFKKADDLLSAALVAWDAANQGSIVIGINRAIAARRHGLYVMRKALYADGIVLGIQSDIDASAKYLGEMVDAAVARAHTIALTELTSRWQDALKKVKEHTEALGTAQTALAKAREELAAAAAADKPAKQASVDKLEEKVKEAKALVEQWQARADELSKAIEDMKKNTPHRAGQAT